MSPPPIGDLPFEVTRTSVFLVSRVPASASSTFCVPCVQVPATSILPLPISFLLQVQASPSPFDSALATSSLSPCSCVRHCSVPLSAAICFDSWFFTLSGTPGLSTLTCLMSLFQFPTSCFPAPDHLPPEDALVR